MWKSVDNLSSCVLKFVGNLISTSFWESRPHCLLYTLLMTLMGKISPLESRVVKDLLASYCWFGGMCCSVQADAQIMKPAMSAQNNCFPHFNFSTGQC